MRSGAVATRASAPAFRLPNGSYSTTFQKVENPLRENGVWLNGGTEGGHWTDMSVSSIGACIGHEVGATTTDGTAVVQGTFTRAQWARATVFVNPAVQDAWDAELEIRLLSKITAGVIRGLEFTIHVMVAANGNGYAAIARWDGWDTPNGRTDFAYVQDPGPSTGASFCLLDGDEIAADVDASGHARLLKNGSVLLTATDVTYTDGNPGIGANLENAVSGAPGNNDKYGFVNFSCGNGALP